MAQNRGAGWRTAAAVVPRPTRRAGAGGRPGTPAGASAPQACGALGLQIGHVAAQALIARVRSVPAPQTVRALIDTGADRTAIHPVVLGSIASPPAGTARVRRPGGTGAFRSVALHDVRLAIAGSPTPAIPTAWAEIEAVALAPAEPGALAPIGRDLPARCQFFPDGWRGESIPVS